MERRGTNAGTSSRTWCGRSSIRRSSHGTIEGELGFWIWHFGFDEAIRPQPARCIANRRGGGVVVCIAGAGFARGARARQPAPEIADYALDGGRPEPARNV